MSNRNSQQQSNNNHNQRRRGRGRGRGRNTNQMSSLPGSALPVPSSRARRSRRSGIHSRQTQQSLEQSTWNQNKRNKIEDLKDGAPYNEWNSFFTQCSCDEILRELTLALKSQPDLDINIHPSGYKIRGRKFIDQFMIEFQIEMFYTSNKHKNYPNHILVEFQRRNGDGFVFQQFLHSIFTELHKTNLVSFSKFPVTTNCYLSPTPLNANNNNNNNNDNDDNDMREEEEKKHDHHHHNNDHHNNHHHDNDAHWKQPPKQIDQQTLKMLIGALFAGDNQMCRSASSYLANNIANNQSLVYDIIKLEPHIITKFSDLLLKCVDPQIVRSIGCTLYHMLQQSDKLRNEALKLNVKTVCKKVYKRWTEPVETRYGSNNKYVIRVIPSMQVAQRMNACIEVLE